MNVESHILLFWLQITPRCLKFLKKKKDYDVGQILCQLYVLMFDKYSAQKKYSEVTVLG